MKRGGDLGDAMPGLRVKQFVEGFGDSGFFDSICQDDLGPVLARFGRRVGEMVGP